MYKLTVQTNFTVKNKNLLTKVIEYFSVLENINLNATKVNQTIIYG